MSDRVSQAFFLAESLHRTQVRKGTEIPYIAHLLAVAALVMENGGDEDQVIAALLHDGPEDQGGEATLAEIRKQFGDRVAAIVEGCSDTFEDPKPPWKARKLSYLDHLKKANEDVLLISLADKVHNLRSIVRDYRNLGEDLWSRFNTDREGTLWYYTQLLGIYEKRSSPQLERLLDQFRCSHAELARMVEEATKHPGD